MMIFTVLLQTSIFNEDHVLTEFKLIIFFLRDLRSSFQSIIANSMFDASSQTSCYGMRK